MAERVWQDAHGNGSRSSWSFGPSSADAGCSLSIAPGRRFRADGLDGTWALGCDGAGFGFTPPDGLPVIGSTDPHSEGSRWGAWTWGD
jgi:hypothetical protein